MWGLQRVLPVNQAGVQNHLCPALAAGREHRPHLVREEGQSIRSLYKIRLVTLCAARTREQRQPGPGGGPGAGTVRCAPVWQRGTPRCPLPLSTAGKGTHPSTPEQLLQMKGQWTRTSQAQGPRRTLHLRESHRGSGTESKHESRAAVKGSSTWSRFVDKASLTDSSRPSWVPDLERISPMTSVG